MPRSGSVTEERHVKKEKRRKPNAENRKSGERAACEKGKKKKTQRRRVEVWRKHEI